MNRRYNTKRAKYYAMIWRQRYEHTLSVRFRITAEGDKRITADGNVRITADTPD